MSAVFDDGLSLFGVRRMMEGVIPPVLCTASADRVPNVSYLSLCEYVDPLHIALSYQFFNRSRENVLATRRAALTLDDPYTGGGVVMQLEYQRTETEGPVFERLRAKLMGVASHVGMDKVFHLRGADIYRVLEMRRVPGRRELPAAAPRVDLATNSRLLSERMAHCEDMADLLDTLLGGLSELLRIDHAMLWLSDPAQQALTLLASRGYDFDGAGAEISVGHGRRVTNESPRRARRAPPPLPTRRGSGGRGSCGRALRRSPPSGAPRRLRRSGRWRVVR